MGFVTIKRCSVAIICCSLVFWLAGCSSTKSVCVGSCPPVLTPGPPPHAPAYGYRAKHTYYYYPESQVYFDINRSMYFYIDNGNWRMAASLPGDLRLQLGGYVTIEMDSDKPYTSFEEHKKKYPPGQMKEKKNGKKK